MSFVLLLFILFNDRLEWSSYNVMEISDKQQRGIISRDKQRYILLLASKVETFIEVSMCLTFSVYLAESQAEHRRAKTYIQTDNHTYIKPFHLELSIAKNRLVSP